MPGTGGTDCVSVGGRRVRKDGNLAPGARDGWDTEWSGTVGRANGGGLPADEVSRARAVWLEVVEGVRGSATALMARIDALTAPDRVEEAAMLAAWKEKYEKEITVRT